MSYARQMLGSYPAGVGLSVGAETLAAAIDALHDCAQACAADNDADLTEPNVADMVACIRLCQDCVDVCTAAAGLLSRPVGWADNVIQPLLEACVAVCQSCGAECERHAAAHAHCRVCAVACRSCEQACRELLNALR